MEVKQRTLLWNTARDGLGVSRDATTKARLRGISHKADESRLKREIFQLHSGINTPHWGSCNDLPVLRQAGPFRTFTRITSFSRVAFGTNTESSHNSIGG